ncbi:hypothetical protein [Roseixanthobacter glucoisosaccharinicivorans]|uniref:hypothetical protein n=1 Tax=Roseixanthobacter glucoisosaccharinicivorans TaxID=3119923 RepID=UPI003726F941
MTRIEPNVHEVPQPIREVIVTYDDYQTHTMGLAYCVGMDGVTRIEACAKSAEFSNIPYLRVWSGERCIAEFCQHKVAAVFFAKDEGELSDD